MALHSPEPIIDRKNTTMIMKKGFTLIELLIVIGILAILATTVVLVLNPAQLLAETRDTQRFNDLDSLRTAIALYLTAVPSPTLQAVGVCRRVTGTVNFWASIAGVTSPFVAFASPELAIAQHANTSRVVSGSGWVPVDFGAAALGGAPFANLPIDPSNSTTNFYAYSCDNGTAKTFELNANLESSKYTTGTTNKEVNTFDGGNNDNFYEIGTEPGLDL